MTGLSAAWQSQQERSGDGMWPPAAGVEMVACSRSSKGFGAMAEDLGAAAAKLLVDQADAAYGQGRYREAVAAAGRAVQAARHLDNPVLLVHALRTEASALAMLGDDAAALARCTEILGLAQDPATSRRLDDPAAAEAVARAHWNWVNSARYLTSIPMRELFSVLDAADRWLAAAGHRDWRAAVLHQRALVHTDLGENDAAVDCAQEALDVKLQYPGAPGYSLAAHRFGLADILHQAGRAAEAIPHYRAIIDDHDSGPYERSVAHWGLARCALAAEDPATAQREAQLAVQLAEPLGDDALCPALETLAAACRAAGDLEAAWQAATWHLEAAGRIGGHYRAYYAARDAADVALDRGDHSTAHDLLADLDQHAQAMDTATASATYTTETARRHERLAKLTARSP
jgi:tetratricopeptide (TPR) repeat protein